MSQLYIYNTLTRKKELFTPLNPPFVGLYVCGPTVYGHAHIGHARPAITFDLLFRYLRHLDYKVRYVRNITDVGHLENDADSGDDKIGKKARLEQIEPMEVAQYYADSYHHDMELLNVLKPSIEPHASGHILEQQEMVSKILEKGFAYISNGSVYFDVAKYNEQHHYGKLSGRILDDLLTTTRELDGQEEKHNPFDFALWKKADPEHIMRWNSPWGEGFPGWHLECSTMSMKYLGEIFDIHGGGMDLLFPHHECEIAQSKIATGHDTVRYWIHNNLITINGQKMGKSLGNSILLSEIFSGNHPLLEQAYHPMTIRFFILQAHYRSTLDFSNEALQASEKGLNRLLKTVAQLDALPVSEQSTIDVTSWVKNCYDALNDDLNTPVMIAHLFDMARLINLVKESRESINAADLDILKRQMHLFLEDILGIKMEQAESGESELLPKVIQLVLDIRQEAKKNRNFELSDQIRNQLGGIGITVKDRKDGADWEIE
ncbi:MAG: cysteine--tRNA ligase [Bacteroidales bacterium]|nr:cysteine--tRNA ligase [Bacteroidales bacterium]MDD3384681.1 cysteine--tRNA ligase [Bacteroidales bacterium]MDD3810766.1 cysteine--tRNA ligase [Bacteroidales bacterium]MDD3871056.1 cysteine--tRNA ligase [Bacteroidales bacterium]MDD4812776.1 cysteine--tRNA ligase [Bacteroidales bacterium]